MRMSPEALSTPWTSGNAEMLKCNTIYLPHLQGIRDPQNQVLLYLVPEPGFILHFFSNTNFTSTFYIQPVNNMWKMPRERTGPPLHICSYSAWKWRLQEISVSQGIEWFHFAFHAHPCISLPVLSQWAVFTAPVRTHRVYNVRINNQQGSNNLKEEQKRKLEVPMRRSMDIWKLIPN